MTRSDADGKVAADYVDKQYQNVLRSLDGLVEFVKRPQGDVCSSHWER